jgi:hypothetical protein
MLFSPVLLTLWKWNGQNIIFFITRTYLHKMTVLTKKQMMNGLNSECGVGQMESTGKFFFM